MTYICKYCGRVCKTQAGLGYHENRCTKNPNRVEKQKPWNAKVYTKTDIISKIKTTSYKLADELLDKEYHFGDKITLICSEHGSYSTTVHKIFTNKFCGCNKCSFNERIKSRKVSTEEWIKRFRKTHGNKYDYSKVDINNTVDGKVIIICPIHGEFLQHPKNHAGGQGCPKCNHTIWNNSDECKQKLINTVNEVFKEKYVESTHIYSFEKTVITGLNKEIVVTCKEHGDFITTPYNIMNGHGCKKCGFLNRNASHTYSLEDWINKFKEIHEDKYDYSKVSLNDIKEKGKCLIVCPIHGAFWKNPVKHLSQGCPKCGRENAGLQTKLRLGEKYGYTTNELKKYLINKFGDLYDFSKVVCNTANDMITIICKDHGEFQITAAEARYNKILCPVCNKKDFVYKDDLLNIIHEKFGNDYYTYKIQYHLTDFSKREYVFKNDKITLVCKEHGDFDIKVSHILDKKNNVGCKKCVRTYSWTNDEFIQMCKDRWGDKYDYSKTKYKTKYDKITVICPIHGEFQINPYTHLRGKTGCYGCSGHSIEAVKLNNSVKLNILTKYDLTNLHWTIILDLIGSDKLPKEFHKLCKYGENTPERKKMVQDLIDTYNIDVEEVDTDETEDNTIDENIEVEVSTIPEEELLNEDIYNEDEVKELEPLKEIKEIADMIDEDDIEVFSTGDKWTHIISKEMSRLWNSVLRDNENHNTNTIDNIKNKLNETLTKFEEYVYNMFLKEYEDVVDFEVS